MRLWTRPPLVDFGLLDALALGAVLGAAAWVLRGLF